MIKLYNYPFFAPFDNILSAGSELDLKLVSQKLNRKAIFRSVTVHSQHLSSQSNLITQIEQL
jgi:hypothetical protein